MIHILAMSVHAQQNASAPLAHMHLQHWSLFILSPQRAFSSLPTSFFNCVHRHSGRQVAAWSQNRQATYMHPSSTASLCANRTDNTWSDNKVRELIAVKCHISHCWISLWSPSKYSPWEAIDRCQRLLHLTKQFWNWFCGMAFRAAVVLLLMSSMSSFQYFLYLRKPKKKSLGSRSGE
jgi:hypothetical protein